MFDLVIRNATIYDGTGKDGFVGNVALQDGKIAAVTTGELTGKDTIDATGLALSPGFIDSHSHGDLSIATNPDHVPTVQQGITFAVGGQCGGSVAPSSLANRFATMAEFADHMNNRPISIHMGVLTGHGSLRTMVMGLENRAPTDQELEQMATILRSSLEAGSMGMSLGLYYPPGSYAESHELITLAKVVKEKGGVLVAHMRNESDRLLEAAEEFIGLCRTSGCRGVISHLKAAEKANHYKLALVIAMIEQAREEGLDIYADAYPYAASSTSLAARFIPRQFIPAGTKEPADVLEDPAVRDKIRAWGMEMWNMDLSFVLVVGCSKHPEYAGLNLNQIAEKMGHGDPYEAVFSILRERVRCQCCFHTMSEENVALALAHPMVMIGTDSDGGSKSAKFHPRRTGTFPRALGRYVREQGITTLPEMIRKMTSLPAHVYGLKTKGRIAEGMDADLCLFDPGTIRDHADYVNCAEPNTGMRYVIIGGKLVVENDVFNGTRAGRLYLR